jgi:hypothetical protein
MFETSINRTDLIAGPPPANPPLLVAIMLIALGLAAPILFLKAGAPSPLFGIAVLALAAAGIITAFGAVSAQLRRRADSAIRPRASITPAGITLRPHAAGAEQHFAAAQIKTAQLFPGALVIQTAPEHPKPGRHVLRFGKLATPREELNAAISALLFR